MGSHGFSILNLTRWKWSEFATEILHDWTRNMKRNGLPKAQKICHSTVSLGGEVFGAENEPVSVELVVGKYAKCNVLQCFS